MKMHMSKASKIIIVAALFSAAIPLLGFRSATENALVILLGLSIAAIMYWAEKHALLCETCNPLATQNNLEPRNEKITDTFSENDTRPQQSTPFVIKDIPSREEESNEIASQNTREFTESPAPTTLDAIPQEKPKRAARKKIIVAS